MKVYIHIGLPKTGTSSIQYFCNKNREYLLTKGILYPKTGIQGDAHHLFARAFIEEHEKEAAYLKWINPVNLEKLLSCFVDEVRDSGANQVLISSEAFGVHILRRMIDYYRSCEIFSETYIIVYLPRQDEYIEGKYAHDRRVGSTDLDPENFLLQHKGDLEYLWLINYLENLVGRTHIKLGVFEKTAIEGNVVNDFLKNRMGVLDLDSATTEIFNNTRLMRDALEYLENIRYTDTATSNAERLIPILEKWSVGQNDQYKYFFSPTTRKIILTEQSENNREIARRYLKNADGKLFQDESVSDEWQAYPGISEETALSIREFIRNFYKAPVDKSQSDG